VQPPSKTLWAVIVLALMAVIWLVWLRYPDFPLDDPYIVQHSVDGLLHGGETRFIGSTPLQGATSPVLLLLITALAWAMPTAWAQAIVIATAAALYLLGIFRLADDAGAGTPWAALLTLLALLAGNDLLQLLNGLETGLAMAAIIWAFIWFRDPEPSHPWQYALAGVLPFIRPELTLLSLALLARAVWSVRQRQPLLPLLRPMAVWTALGAAPLFTFLLANGSGILPNTVAAKAYFFAEGCRLIVQKLLHTKQAGGFFLQEIGLAFLGFVALPLARVRWIALSFIPIFLLAYVLRLPGALNHNFHRYLYVLMPFAFAGWVVIVTLRNQLDRRIGRALLVAALGVALVRADVAWKTYVHYVQFSRTELAGVTDWLAEHVAEGDTVLVHDAGYISLRGRQPLVDLVGLKSPASVEVHRRYTWTTCGNDPRAMDAIARQSGARYLVVLDDWDRIFQLSEGLRRTGWSVTRADRERGQTRYAVYRIVSPERAVR
jgi:hypothetical protein